MNKDNNKECQDLQQPLNHLIKCKFCGREPKHRVYDVIFHQYICYCLHRTPNNITSLQETKEEWYKQNTF